ncbi:MAG: copper chaperone PCu(A)C [Paracoccaceae bacterium]
MKRNIVISRAFALLAAVTLAAPAFAHDYRVGDLFIDHPTMPQPAASARAGGGHMRITNEGTTDDKLIGIEVDFAKGELHGVDFDDNGVARMYGLDSIEIPAGETVLLERGGLHVMFMGLERSPQESEMVPATLIFEQAGPVEIEFQVIPSTGAAGGHHNMGH